MLRSVADGIDPDLIRDIYETKLDSQEGKQLSAVRIWSDAGGFCPTIGIIGAVLGLQLGLHISLVKGCVLQLLCQ